MADVTVFVDDVVRGDLPPVCVKTGRAADMLVEDRADVSSLGWSWLLVLIPGVGWLVFLAVVLVASSSERIIVRLPFSRAAANEIRSLRRIRNLAVLAGMAFWMVAALTSARAGYSLPSGLFLVLGATLALGAVLVNLSLRAQEVVVRLDASRRWVTLSGVSPTFADQVHARQRHIGNVR